MDYWVQPPAEAADLGQAALTEKFQGRSRFPDEQSSAGISQPRRQLCGSLAASQVANALQNLVVHLGKGLQLDEARGESPCLLTMVPPSATARRPTAPSCGPRAYVSQVSAECE